MWFGGILAIFGQGGISDPVDCGCGQIMTLANLFNLLDLFQPSDEKSKLNQVSELEACRDLDLNELNKLKEVFRDCIL